MDKEDAQLPEGGTRNLREFDFKSFQEPRFR